MTVCCPGWIGTTNPTRTTEAHHQDVWLYLLMMGIDTPETRTDWQNIVRISCASSWLFFYMIISRCTVNKPKTNLEIRSGHIPNQLRRINHTMLWALNFCFDMTEHGAKRNKIWPLNYECYRNDGRIFRNVTTLLAVLSQRLLNT